jgi:hypothetical protein
MRKMNLNLFYDFSTLVYFWIGISWLIEHSSFDLPSRWSKNKSPGARPPSSRVSTQGKYVASFSLHFTLSKHVLLWAYSRYTAPTWGTHLFQNVEQNMFKLVRYNQRQKTGTFYKYNLQLSLVLISYIYPDNI